MNRWTLPESLPEPIDAYFAAEQHGAGAVARCFSADAVVLDEGRTYTGPAAIEAWKAAASAAYASTSEPFALQHHDGLHIVTSRVTGNFPGSPVDLRYRFRLECGQIASLEIGA